MQRFTGRLFALTCFFLACLAAVPAIAQDAQNEVAQVGNVSISVHDLNRAIQKILPFNVSFHGKLSKEKINEIRKKALDGLVERALKIQYALSEELVVDNSQVTARFQKVRDKFKSDEDFQKALGSKSPSSFRADLYRDLLAEKAEQVAVDSQVKVSEDEIAAYYKENQARFVRPRQYRASHILIKVDPASNQEERAKLLEKAEELAKRAKAGEDFYNLAYYNSDDRSKYVGGDLGVFHEGQTVKEFDDALAKMKPGEIAGPVKTMFGYHIIKLDDVKESRQLTYEEMHDKIKQDLEKQQREKILANWLEGLKKQYPVTYR